MPITYEIDPGRRAVIATSAGALFEPEIRAVAKAAFLDPRFDPTYRAFFDHSQVTDWQVSTGFMVEMARARQRSSNSRTAVLVQGALSFGLVRAYQTFVESGQVRIFTVREEALAWLNEGVLSEQHLT